MKIKHIGSLGLKHWGGCWALALGFLMEDDLDGWENWLYEIKRAYGRQRLSDVERLYMLARLTLLQLPRSWYLEQFDQMEKGCAPDCDALARLWFRLSHSSWDNKQLQQYESGNKTITGKRLQDELDQLKITAAMPFALSDEGNRLRLYDEATRAGFVTDEVYREKCYRNAAFAVVSAGILESLDALAAGVPAEYL